jgi:hypothetical protein
MSFDECLEEIHIKNSTLTACIRQVKVESSLNVDEEASILNQIESIHFILAQEWFQNELNENIFHFENLISFEFFISLIENIVSFIELFNCTKSTIKTLKIMKEISMLNIVRFLKIKSNLLIRLLTLLENNDFDTSVVLTVATELSANQFLGRIDYSSVDFQYVHSFLDEFINKFPEHSNYFAKIVENLNKNSIEDRLLEFRHYYDEHKHVYELVEKENFSEDIKFISLNLNKNINRNFYNELFTKYDSYSIFERLLEHFLGKLFNMHKQNENELEESDDESEDVESVCRFLRDLLGIIHKGKFTDHFLNEKILKLILKLYENVSLLKYLFVRFNNVLALTMQCVFSII